MFELSRVDIIITLISAIVLLITNTITGVLALWRGGQSTQTVHTKLDEIHVQVNSNLHNALKEISALKKQVAELLPKEEQP